MRKFFVPIIALVFASLVVLIYIFQSHQQPSRDESIISDMTPAPTPAPDTTPVLDVSKETAIAKDTPEAILTIKVLNNKGVPLPDASATFYSQAETLLPIPPESAFMFTADNQGVINIQEIPRGVYIVDIQKDMYAPYTQLVSLGKKDSPRAITVTLQRAARIAGTVKDESQKPLAAVNIGPLLPSPEAERQQVVVPRFATASPNGSFSFTVPENGFFDLHVYSPGYVPLYIGEIPAGQENMQIILKKGGADVSGFVVGSRDGKPIERKIGLLLVGNNHLIHTLAGSKGAFAFHNIPPGDYYIEPIENGKKVGRPVTFQCSGTQPVVNLIIKANQGIYLSGKLESVIQKIPVSSVLLKIGESENAPTVISDENGEFVFPDIMPEGQIRILIMSPEYAYYVQNGALSDRYMIDDFMPDTDINDVVIPIVKKFILRGNVRNIDKESIKEYKVRIEPLENKDMWETKSVMLKDDAGFTMAYAGEGSFAALVLNGKEELAGTPVKFSLSPTQDSPILNLSKQEPYEFLGRVLDHAGDFLPDCRVKSQGIVESKTTTTDESGDFTLTTYEKKLTVSVSSNKYSHTLQQEIELPLDGKMVFQFSSGNVLSGVVRDPLGEPVPFAQISYSWAEERTGMPQQHRINASKEGTFTITDVTSSYIDTLICMDSPDERKERKLGKAEFRRLEVPREDFIITLPYVVRVDITVKDESNNPYTGAATLEVVFARQEIESREILFRQTVEMNEGSYVFEEVGPGSYIFFVKTVDGQSGNSEEITIQNDSSREEVLIVLHSAGRIYGTVFDQETGQPLENAKVILSGIDPGQQRIKTTVNTDQQGAFEIQNSPDCVGEITGARAGFAPENIRISISRGVPDITMPLSIYLKRANASVKGITFNKEMKPEPFTMIVIVLQTEEEELSNSWKTASDAGGQFAYYDLSAGDFTIIAEKENLSYSGTFHLDEGEQKEIQVVLTGMVMVNGTIITEDKGIFSQPFIFTHKMTHRSFAAIVDPDGKFTIQIPHGEYTVGVGETDLFAEVTIPDDSEDIEIELTF